MIRASIAGAALLVVACAPGSQLPGPVGPLQPTPDAPFRERPPAALTTVAAWESPVVHSRRLANGMLVQVVEVPGVPVANVRYVNREAIEPYHSEKHGLTMLTGAALLQGTKRADGNVSQGLRVAGQTPEVDVSQSGTWLELDVLAPKVGAAISTLARIVRYPALDERALRAAGGMRRALELPGMDRTVRSVTFGALFGPHHPWAASPNQRQREQASITPEDVRRFYGRVYVPPASALIVAGDVSAQHVFALAETHFGPWQGTSQGVPHFGLDIQPQKNDVHAFHSPGMDQAAVIVVQPAVGTDDPSYHAFNLLALIVGGTFHSRAQVALRHHEGATYGVYANVRAVRRGGYLEISTMVDTSRVRAAVTAVREGLNRIRRDGVTPAELATAKAAYLARLRATSARGIADRLRAMFTGTLPSDALQGAERTVELNTNEDLQRLATRHFTPDSFTVIAQGDYREFRDALDVIGEVKLHQPDESDD